MSLAPGLLLAGWLASAQVPEPPAAVDVEWVVPPGCPDRAALLEGVARRRGRPLAPGQARVVGRTTVDRGDARRYRLVLAVDVAGHRDTRVLRARTCGALVDGAALLIALAVDGQPGLGPLESALPGPGAEELSEEPGSDLVLITGPGAADGDESPALPVPVPASPDPPASAGPRAPAPTGLGDPAPPGSGSAPPPAGLRGPLRAVGPLPDPADQPPTPPASELTQPDAPAPPSRWRPGGFLRLHGLAELGALPGPTGGVGLAGGLLWRHLRVELQATYLAPRAIESPAFRGSLVAGSALACARLGRGRLELPICAGLEAGGMPGAAETADGRRSAVGRWLALTAGFGAAVRVHPRVALWAFLHGLAALQRGTFAVRAPGSELAVVFDPGLGSGRLALGVEVRFGDPR